MSFYAGSLAPEQVAVNVDDVECTLILSDAFFRVCLFVFRDFFWETGVSCRRGPTVLINSEQVSEFCGLLCVGLLVEISPK